MSVNVAAELHPIKRNRVHITTGPKPIADIIQELNAGFPLSQARACRNGEIVTDFSTMANDGDSLVIKFVPHGSNEDVGMGMKAGGWALMVAGIITVGILGVTGIGGMVGAALIGTGLSMALGGTVLMNINTPPSLKDRKKPEEDPSIRGGKNQMRQYGRIPVLFGRHRLYPDLAANPHTSIIGSQQFFTQLFCGGYKDYVIDINSFKLGETYLTELSETKDINKILSGADPVIRLEILQNGEASTLYPYCVHEDAVNAPLKNRIEGANGIILPGELTRTTPDNTDAVNVDIFFFNGLGKYNDSGGLDSASVQVKASYKPFAAPDSSYTLLGYFNNGSNTIFGAELRTKRFQITKSGLPRGQYTVKIERVTPDTADSKIIDQVYVGSIRSIKSKDDDGNVVRPVRAERQRDLTIIALRVLATAQMNGILDSFNYVATAKLPVYPGNGSGALYWLNAAETRNPASALLYALQGRAAQQSVNPNDLDWPSLEAFYTWCEQKDDDGDYKYACDAYLSESVTIAEIMRMIGSTARADILRIDSKISVVQDIERPFPVQLFTPKNSIAYSITMFSADIPNAVDMQFIDEASGYAQNELRVHNTPDGNPVNDITPDTVQKAALWGVANSKQARRLGMYNYACMKNRPFVHTIEADIEYLICNKGDWIQYAGDIALAGSTQGRIKGIIWADGVCVGIDTDEPMAMADGKQYAVRIRRSDGSVILRDAVFSLGRLRQKSVVYHPGEGEELYEPFIGDLYAVDENGNTYYEPENILFFTEPFEKKDAPKAGDIYAFGVRGYEAIDLIITDIAPGQNLTAVLTCVEYSPEIFGVDQGGFVLPDFENKITPVSGAVDSGAVNPDRWRSFAAYHDSEDEPSRPSGDGQGGGWHHVETFRSVWQSTKVAESVESGEWGLPVRIRAERGTDDVTPVWLSLSPQNITLETDVGGSLLAGLLPLTVQARLHRWNSVLAGVTFSLVSAPAGISVNSTSGVITVAANAALAETNKIAVRAVYQGAAYTATLSIDKSINNSAPRYLGTVEALTTASATVIIIKGPAVGIAQARQGDYVLAVAPVGGRVAGSVFQWGGAAWEYRAPQNYSNLYISCFKDGLEVPALAQDIGWFGGIFAGLICAQAGFIEELETQVIKLNAGGVIYGGNKYLANGNNNPQAPVGAKGFWVGANGEAKLEEATVSGTITAKSGSFKGTVTADSGVLNYVTINASCTVKGMLEAGQLKINGTHIAGQSKVVAYDNIKITRKDRVPVNNNEFAAKKLRVAGRGQVRFHVKFRGMVAIYSLKDDGSLNLEKGNLTSNSAANEIWTDPIDLIKDVNIFFLFGHDYGGTNNNDYTFENTIFEARTSNEPGLFKYLSSPF